MSKLKGCPVCYGSGGKGRLCKACGGMGKVEKEKAERLIEELETARATPAQPVPVEAYAAEDGVEHSHPQYGRGVFFTFDCAKELYENPPEVPESDVSAPSPSSVGAAIHDEEHIRAEVDWENGLTQLLEGYKHATDYGICSRESIQQNIIDYVLAHAAPSIAQDGQGGGDA